MNDLAVFESRLSPDVEVSTTALQVRGLGLSFEQFEEALSGVLGMGDSVRWWIGDLLLYGRSQFGESYAQALQETRLTEHQLTKYRWVAENVQPSLRRENLSFSHHELVAALEPPDQQRLLALAETSTYSVAQLREAVRDHKAFVESPTRRVTVMPLDEVDAARGVRTVRTTLVRLGNVISPEAREESGINASMSALTDVTKTVKRVTALEPLALAVAAVLAAGVKQPNLPEPAVIVPSGPWDTLVAAYATVTDGGT